MTLHPPSPLIGQNIGDRYTNLPPDSDVGKGAFLDKTLDRSAGYTPPFSQLRDGHKRIEIIRDCHRLTPVVQVWRHEGLLFGRRRVALS